jgi:hypothetical protein
MVCHTLKISRLSYHTRSACAKFHVRRAAVPIPKYILVWFPLVDVACTAPAAPHLTSTAPPNIHNNLTTSIQISISLLRWSNFLATCPSGHFASQHRQIDLLDYTANTAIPRDPKQFNYLYLTTSSRTMAPSSSFIARHEDKTALGIIATVVVYCIYACIAFYRARLQRCIALKGDEERETRYVKRVEIIKSPTKITRHEHNKQTIYTKHVEILDSVETALRSKRDESTEPVKLIEVDEPRRHVRLISHNDKSQIVLASETYEGMSVLETTVSTKTDLIDLGDCTTEPCGLIQENMESDGLRRVVISLESRKSKKRSTWTEEFEGRNSGSAGTRGLGITRGDAEISMGDEEDETN